MYRDGGLVRGDARRRCDAARTSRTTSHHPVRAAPPARQTARGARSARRGLHADRRLRGDEPRRARARREDVRESAQCRRRQPAPARPAPHRAAAARSLLLRLGVVEGGASRTAERAREPLAQLVGACAPVRKRVVQGVEGCLAYYRDIGARRAKLPYRDRRRRLQGG